MPKELIRDDVNTFAVRIGWERGSCVQVATVRPDRELRMSYDKDGDGEVFYGDGLYATFDSREQINNMIRVLRRARDQAFGADE